jgi:hypothetical protein
MIAALASKSSIATLVLSLLGLVLSSLVFLSGTESPSSLSSWLNVPFGPLTYRYTLWLWNSDTDILSKLFRHCKCMSLSSWTGRPRRGRGSRRAAFPDPATARSLVAPLPSTTHLLTLPFCLLPLDDRNMNICMWIFVLVSYICTVCQFLASLLYIPFNGLIRYVVLGHLLALASAGAALLIFYVSVANDMVSFFGFVYNYSYGPALYLWITAMCCHALALVLSASLFRVIRRKGSSSSSAVAGTSKGDV